MSINSTRSGLYRAARLLGDVQAVSKGPKAMAKRTVRKRSYKTLSVFLRMLLK